MSKRIKETYHKLGELLVRKNLATSQEVDEALAVQRTELTRGRTALKLGEILVERKVLTRKVIHEILEEQQIGRGEKRTLRVDLRNAKGVAVVSLVGRLESGLEEAVTHVFEKLMNRGFNKIAVDCRQLVFLDSHGVSSFVSYVDEARARSGDVKFFGLNAEAKIVLRHLELDKFLQTFDTERAAIAAHSHPIDAYMSHGALAEFIAPAGQRQYHLSYCSDARRIHEEDRIYFQSRTHAQEAGKAPCKRCRP